MVNIKSIKKILAYVLALLLIMSVNACGNNKKTDSNYLSTTGTASYSYEDGASTTGNSTNYSSNDNNVNDSGVSDGYIRSDLTALELTQLMGNGINLGNTMEAWNRTELGTDADISDYETCWGQPVTTADMIQGMKDAGFDTIRIPVAWVQTMDFENGDYTIRNDLLDRVEEIIGYAMDAGMYVIINDHWDGGWWAMFSEDKDKAMELYTSMWSQIADRYKDYSDYLIFESSNEELGNRLDDSYPDEQTIIQGARKLTSQETYTITNEINQKFVDTIRQSGGNNAERFLLIAGYDTNIESTCDERFVMPTDSANSKLLISVHYYDPSGYCIFDSVSNWGDTADYTYMNDTFSKMTKFTDDGYGVVIGEYGVVQASDEGTLKDGAIEYIENLLNNCDLYGYCPVLWDTNFVYDKESCRVSFDELMRMYQKYSLKYQELKTSTEIKEAAQKYLDEALENAEPGFVLSDDEAIAWIMYTSSDWAVQYSVGDEYNPDTSTEGIIAIDEKITGEGEYTVSIDLTGTSAGCGEGCAFMALGIANGETLYPGYVIDIESVKINGQEVSLLGKTYTTSDDNKCTRVNLYNEWVVEIPDDIRTIDGDTSIVTSVPLDVDSLSEVTSIEITFNYIEP